MPTEIPAVTFRFGPFEVDGSAGELHRNGLRVKLQEQPVQLLLYLLQHPGQVVTREELRHALWSDHTFVDFDRGLNRAMNKLRAALCDSADRPRYIETLHRRGYRLIAPVTVHYPEQLDKDAEMVYRSHTSGEIRALTSEGIEKKPPVAAYGMLPVRRLPLAVLILAICATTVYSWRTHSAVLDGVLTPPAPRRSVAVLGFKNLSGRSDEGWVSTALADWLTTQLAAGGHLRLIPPEDVARMKIELSPLDVGSLSRNNLSLIGKNLSTDSIVVGSYAVVGSGADAQVRLDLRLQDVRTGNIVEAVSKTGTEAHLFDLVLRAGETLRSALGLQPVSSSEAAEVAVALPSRRDAARLYSEGLEALRVFNALGGRDLLKNAIAAEPTFALSHSALATAWANLGYDEMARREAKRAFELSSDLSRADRLLVEARYHAMSEDWGKAVEIYRAIFEFFPDSLEYGLALAEAQLGNGKTKDAMITLDALRKLPAPLGGDARIDLVSARAAESLGDFKTDLEFTSRAADKARALEESLLLAQARVDQAWALANLGQGDEASDAAAEAQKIFAKAGDRRGLAQSINFAGILKEDEGDSIGAKRNYEEALGIYREIGNKLGVANELDDLGDVHFSLGYLVESRRDYEQAMSIYAEVGHENGVCLTKGALGPVLLALGDGNSSIRISQEAVDICNRLGDQSKAAIALLNLGRALRLQGRMEEASEAGSRAVSGFVAVGDKLSAARARLTYAELLLEEGDLDQARSAASDAVKEFVRQKAARDAAVAYAVLSQVFLRSGDIGAARQATQQAADYLLKCSDREAELMVAISAARIQAVAGGPARDVAAKSFQEIATKASRLGFVPYEFEPRLALAEIEVNLGDPASAKSHLEALRKEATDHGFGLIAIKAAGDLKTLFPNPSQPLR